MTKKTKSGMQFETSKEKKQRKKCPGVKREKINEWRKKRQVRRKRNRCVGRRNKATGEKS